MIVWQWRMRRKRFELSNKERLEFYRLIGEGFKDIQDGRTSTISEVREKLEKAREKTWLK